MKFIYFLWAISAMALCQSRAGDGGLLAAPQAASRTISIRAETAVTVKATLVNFEQALQVYVAEQKELQTQLRDPLQNERARIREALEQNREAIAVKREEFKEAVKKLHIDTPRRNVKDDKGARPAGKARH